MPNKKINELPHQTPLTGDMLMIVGDPDSGLLKNCTISEFNGVKRVTITEDTAFVVPAAMLLDKLIVISDADVDLAIGSTDGGQEIKEAVTIEAGDPEVIEMNLYAVADKPIYLSGITGSTLLIFIYKII